MSQLLTIGYGGVDPGVLVASLQEAGAEFVLDVRIHPVSKTQPAYTSQALAELLDHGGMAYQWAGELGNAVLDACREADSLDPYRAYLAERLQALDRLFLLLKAGHKVALLCGCVRVDQCHRSVIVAELRKRYPVEVEHLHPPRGQERGPAPPILGLTLQQPWAWAICEAGKRIENRRWKPWCPKGTYLAIHAGKGWDKQGAAWLISQMAGALDVPTQAEAAQGIVAVARLGEVVQDSQDEWFMGPFGWRLHDVEVLPQPVPCRGAQGLWKLPEDVRLAVRDGVRASRRQAAQLRAQVAHG